LVKCPT
jgi:hypothetical protein